MLWKQLVCSAGGLSPTNIFHRFDIRRSVTVDPLGGNNHILFCLHHFSFLSCIAHAGTLNCIRSYNQAIKDWRVKHDRFRPSLFECRMCFCVWSSQEFHTPAGKTLYSTPTFPRRSPKMPCWFYHANRCWITFRWECHVLSFSSGVLVKECFMMRKTGISSNNLFERIFFFFCVCLFHYHLLIFHFLNKLSDSVNHSELTNCNSLSHKLVKCTWTQLVSDNAMKIYWWWTGLERGKLEKLFFWQSCDLCPCHFLWPSILWCLVKSLVPPCAVMFSDWWFLLRPWPQSVCVPLNSGQPSPQGLLPGGGAAAREEALRGVWHHLLWLPPRQWPLSVPGQ